MGVELVEAAHEPEEATPRDFDFLNGRWTVANRRLKRRWSESQEWEVFPASAQARSVLAGGAQQDEITFPTKGFTGLTLRLFDVTRGRWWLYWANSRDGLLQPPVIGRFHGDTGVFEGDDMDDGRPVRVRYTWSRAGDAPRWEQAFSDDGGRTWQTNWIMELTREAEPAEGAGS